MSVTFSNYYYYYLLLVWYRNESREQKESNHFTFEWAIRSEEINYQMY